MQIDTSTDIGHFAQLITLIRLPKDSFLKRTLDSLGRSIKTSHRECYMGNGKNTNEYLCWRLSVTHTHTHSLLFKKTENVENLNELNCKLKEHMKIY